MAQDSINTEIPMTSDNAILLLAAAEESGLDASVVATSSDGTFQVPQSLVDKAGLGKDKPKPAAKKAAAKKAAPAKKAAAKKAAAPQPEPAAPAADDQKTE